MWVFRAQQLQTKWELVMIDYVNLFTFLLRILP